MDACNEEEEEEVKEEEGGVVVREVREEGRVEDVG